MSINDPKTNTEKREFLGGLIAGALVKKGVEVAVEKALDKVARKEDVLMAPDAIEPAKKEVLKEIKEDLQAQAEHRLDLEPHYSSRNLWGSFVGIITALETIRLFWTDDHSQTVQEWLVPVGIIITALTPLYSRFIAKKPLWR